MFLLAFWVLLAGVRDLLDKCRHKGLLKGMRSLSSSYWGMQLAHLGIAACAIGVVLVSHGSAERDLRLAPGESLELGGYRFVFEGAEHFEGPNFTSDKGTVRVLEDGEEVAVLHPEKRLYTVQQMPMIEAGIDAGFHPRPLRRPWRTAGERGLGRTRAHQALCALDLAGRPG